MRIKSETYTGCALLREAERALIAAGCSAIWAESLVSSIDRAFAGGRRSGCIVAEVGKLLVGWRLSPHAPGYAITITITKASKRGRKPRWK